MDDNYKLQNIIRKELRLAKERERIFKLPTDKIIDAILNCDQPAGLVQSIPKEDFYFLIHDIGVEDSIALLALAEGRQWEYILDLEIWEKDRMDLAVLARWFELLHIADKYRLVNWLVKEKQDLFEYCLFKNIDVRIRQEDETSSDFEDEFFTLDDVYYIRFKDDISENEDMSDEEKNQIQNNHDILLKIIYTLADIDHMIYQKILLETMSILPAETEEDMYRLKNVRLSEKGFFPYDEALEIYSPIEVEEILKNDKKIFPSGLEDDRITPSLPVTYEFKGEDNYFSKAISLIDSEDLLNHLRLEFAGLCNHLISADQRKIRQKDELVMMMNKAGAFLSIGLEILSSDKGSSSFTLAEYLEKYPLMKIFRLGYSRVLNLKFKTDKWVRKSWFKSKGLPIGFWGEELMGILGGLLLNRPMFFDNYRTGLLYREFQTLEEINSIEKRLNELMDYDALFSLVSVDFQLFTNEYLNFKNLVLTLWACHYLGIKKSRPLSLNEFKKLYSQLWQEKSNKRLKIRKIDNRMKESFLNWLSDETGLASHEISQRMAGTLEILFSEIEAEYGDVPQSALDSRFIHLFCIDNREK